LIVNVAHVDTQLVLPSTVTAPQSTTLDLDWIFAVVIATKLAFRKDYEKNAVGIQWNVVVGASH